MNFHPGLYATVLFAGMLSFFSPCILPLLPVYIGCFSSDESSSQSPLASRMKKTLAFTAGVSTVFFLMGVGAGLAGSFLQSSLFVLVCGVVIVFMGVHQIGLIQIPLLDRTKTLSSKAAPGKGLLGAFGLGFFFSFGWTPCVGPILAMVLGISLEQGSALTGGMLLLFYAAGFAIPFLVLAAGSQLLLEKIRCLHPHLGKIKIVGGILVVAMGLWMIAGQIPVLMQRQSESVHPEGNTLSGEMVSLSDWEGKTVYLKFWATWCPSCLSGMREFRELAEEYADSENVVIYSVVAPGYQNEMDLETFTDWATGQGLSFPILFDEGGQLNRQYGIQGYPTSVFLDRNQDVMTIHIGHMNNDEIRKQITELTQETEALE